MNSISETVVKFTEGVIDKPTFIKNMYENHHAKLFDYSTYLKKTNIAAIEIIDDTVIMTSRDNGIRMVCPSADQRVAPIEMLNFLDYEAMDSAMIMRLVSPEDNVIDIGANMGWYSILIAKTYPLCMVNSFEPIPKTYSFLEKNIQINELQNVVAHHFGLSNECKDLTFYFYPEGSGNASSANLSERADAELINCHVQRLDDFVITNKLTIDFIKCDVEGAELFAFQGAVETLKRDKPIVFTEMLRKWAAKFDYHPNEIISLFSSLGYRCFVASDCILHEFFAMNETTIENNFFFLHDEKHQKLIDELFH
jgi:FkbM family methyltransferase